MASAAAPLPSGVVGAGAGAGVVTGTGLATAAALGASTVGAIAGATTRALAGSVAVAAGDPMLRTAPTAAPSTRSRVTRLIVRPDCFSASTPPRIVSPSVRELPRLSVRDRPTTHRHQCDPATVSPRTQAGWDALPMDAV